MTEIQKKGLSSFQNTDTLLDAKNFLLFNNEIKKSFIVILKFPGGSTVSCVNGFVVPCGMKFSQEFNFTYCRFFVFLGNKFSWI